VLQLQGIQFIPYFSILCCLRFNLLLSGLQLLELILHRNLFDLMRDQLAMVCSTLGKSLKNKTTRQKQMWKVQGIDRGESIQVLERILELLHAL
jgi:Ni,Fe-hydrogenase I cytochrome b subunit